VTAGARFDLRAAWRSAFEKFEWNRLNYALIPAAEAASQKPLWPPRSRFGFRLFRLYSSFTREGLILSAATLAVGAFGGDVAHSQVYILFSVLASLIVSCFVVSRFLKPTGIEVKVAAPQRVFVGEALALRLHVRVGDPASGARGPLRIQRPFLPYFGKWLGPSPRVSEVLAGAEKIVATELTFSRRGEITLGAFYTSRIAPFSITSGPFTASRETKVRVVPKPARVILDSGMRAARPPAGGVARPSRSGESMDLLGLRPYRAGDRIRDLSARAWARSRKPVVREYQEEFTACFGVVLITRSSSERAREAAIRLAAGISNALYNSQTQLGVFVADARVHALVGNHMRASYEQVLDLLAAVEGSKRVFVSYDADDLFSRLKPHLSRISTVMFVTDTWGDVEEQLRADIERAGLVVARVGVDVAVPQGRTVDSAAIEQDQSIVL
jgi:uncharacterized protein (DUF58 family)